MLFMKTKNIAISFLVVGLLLGANLVAANDLTAEQAPIAYIPESGYEFADVVEGSTVLHEFIIQNKGGAELKIEKVRTG